MKLYQYILSYRFYMYAKPILIISISLLISLLTMGFYSQNNQSIIYAQAADNKSSIILDNEEKNTFSLFQNSTSGITISYPSIWTNVERSGNVSFAVSSPQGGHFFIIVDKLLVNSLEEHSAKYIQSKNDSLSHFLIFSPPPLK